MATKLKSKKTPANKAAWFALVDDLFAADEKIAAAARKAEPTAKPKK
jgi:hypothetical protein